MSNIDIFKQALTVVAGAGVREIITNTVKHSTMFQPMGRLQSISVSTATVVLTSMVTDAMEQHIDKKVDEIVEKIKEMKEEKA